MTTKNTTKSKKKTPGKKTNQKASMNPFLSDVLCVIALMLALFTGLGIFGYYMGETGNQFFGVFGAIILQIIFSLFGKTAWVVPIFLICWAIHLVYMKQMWSLRMTGVLLLLVSFPYYFSLQKIPQGFTPWEAAGYGIGGGYVGAVLAEVFLKLVGQIGGIIIWLILLIVGIIMLLQRTIGTSIKAMIRMGQRFVSRISQTQKLKEKEKKEKALSARKINKTREKETAVPPVFFSENVFSSSPLPERDEPDFFIRGIDERETPDLVLYETGNKGEENPGNETYDTRKEEMAEKSPDFLEEKKEGPEEKTDLLGGNTASSDVSERPEVIPYQKPSLLLLEHDEKTNTVDRNLILEKSRALEQSLAEFGVKVKVEEVTCGPAVTRYEVSLAPGTKVSKIVGLSDDLQLRLAASGIRIEAPIPGKAAVGIEIPNPSVRSVGLYEILSSENFSRLNHPLTFALGEDITGRAICARLKDMPHLLIAGSTGSGKSVCLNGIIMSFLFNAEPDEVKLVLVDPKMVELAVYNNLPHLMTPVVTDPKKASQILKWMTVEMEKRYKKFAEAGVRDINRYREVTEDPMPYIVIVIDELADLMMVAPGEVEDSICRLAQMARAAGMHLIVATQRPSVDVVTGIIKANIPSRIAFAVSSQMDSRTILDMGGAEKLLGKGDMLFFPVGASKPQRVQGAFVSDDEIEKTVSFITQWNQNRVQYNEELENLPIIESDKSTGGKNSIEEELFIEAVQVFIEAKRASASLLQRRLHIGFVRATDLMELMEKKGIISPVDEKNPRNSRKVLVTEEYLEQFKNQCE